MLPVAGACSIHLLGEFTVEVDGRVVPDSAWRHRRGAELLKLLALTPGHRLLRDQVIDALWPDLPVDAADTNLRKATHHLRRALGTPDPVVVDGGAVALCPNSPIVTDVDEFDAEARQALTSGPEACAAAASRYGGELLPDDRYASWSFELRERLRLRYLQLLKLAGQWDKVLEVDATEEVAHQALMQRAIEAGNRQAALRQFARLRDTLSLDLGVGPDQHSVELYETALAMGGAPSVTATERASGLLARGLLHWNRMELDDAHQCAQEARALAIAEGLGRELGEATALLGMVAHGQGRWREVFRAEFVETLTDRPELAPFVLDAHLCLAEFSLYGPDSCQTVEPFAQELLDIACAAGSVRGQGLASLMLGEAALLSGQLNAASAALGRAARLNRSAEATSALCIALIRSAETESARGRRWQAARLLDRATRLARTAPLSAHLLVRVCATNIESAKTLEQAVAALDQADRDLASHPTCQPCSIGFHVAAATTRARAGDQLNARHHLETAERIAGMWQGGPWQAAVWEARGVVRLAEGDHGQGIALLNEAAELFARCGRSLDAARCRAAT